MCLVMSEQTSFQLVVRAHESVMMCIHDKHYVSGSQLDFRVLIFHFNAKLPTPDIHITIDSFLF